MFGEHAVVYGRPAIAVPVAQIRATCTARALPHGAGLTIRAADLGTAFRLGQASAAEPLAVAARLLLSSLGAAEPDAECLVHSTIPIARGLGSGAAVATALVRALASFVGHPVTPAFVSEIVFEVERIHHGTPSGIDNTVVAYEQPVCFTKGQPVERLNVGTALTLLLGDTGVPSSTRDVVERVRRSWEQSRTPYETLFDGMGAVAEAARRAIEAGALSNLGELMNRNHGLLVELGVSSPELDALIRAARAAGALGAKLVGAGRGGSIAALAPADGAAQLARALLQAGAAGVISTTIEPQAAADE